MKFFTSRIFIISALILIQVLIVLTMVLFLSSYYIWFYLTMLFVSVLIVIVIINRNCNPMFKIAWIIPILLFPICGGLFYLIFGRTHLNKKNKARLENAINSMKDEIPVDYDLLNKVGHQNGHILREATYICNNAYSNIYNNTKTEFLSPGNVFFDQLVEKMQSAEKFIFLEYFIIDSGKMWDTIMDILVEKVKSGVDVWLMYDDIGTISTLPQNYPNILRKLGIKTTVFNPYKPSMDKFLNYRDHRKFAIIDGKYAFTGGINLADEYINEKERFGFWEDCSVMLEGDAVNKVTIMFLQMWNFASGEMPDCKKYITNYKVESDGYVIPFSDEPLDQELICENAYINVINNAKKYIYICTPYLILDEVMTSALIGAAKSGVEVVIITPHIPDKKMVFLMTRSNYKDLLAGGVRIYEFTPGFIHSKTIVSDDVTAIVGTSNFDYRSFYLHFENGVWMHRSKAVAQAKECHLKAMEVSQEITLEFLERIPRRAKVISSLLKMFAPLL